MTYEEYLLRKFKRAIEAALGDLAQDVILNEFLDSADVIDYKLIDEIAEKVKNDIYIVITEENNDN